METLLAACSRRSPVALAKTEQSTDMNFDKWWNAFDENAEAEAAATAATDEDTLPCGCSKAGLLNDEYMVCTTCGQVLERLFDTSAEYRYFANDDRGGDPCRVGAPQDHRLPEASLGTMILGGKGKAMHRIRKFHTWNAMPYKERSLLQTFDSLSLIVTNHGVSHSIAEDTKEMYVALHELCDRRGLTRNAILASCLWTALKQTGSPRKPTEIATMFSLSTATFTKALKYFQEVFALAQQKGLLKKATVDTSYGSTKAENYVALPLSRLPIPRAKVTDLEAVCRYVATVAERDGYSIENVPPSLAAGCVAFVLENLTDFGIPQSDIARAADVSIATLQKCLRRLEGHKEVLVGMLADAGLTIRK